MVGQVWAKQMATSAVWQVITPPWTWLADGPVITVKSHRLSPQSWGVNFARDLAELNYGTELLQCGWSLLGFGSAVD